MSCPPRVSGPMDGLLGQGGPIESEYSRLERKLNDLKKDVDRIWELLSTINHALILQGIIPENRA